MIKDSAIKLFLIDPVYQNLQGMQKLVFPDSPFLCHNKDMGRVSEKIYCAFCRIPRTAYTKKHVGWTNILLSSLMSVLLMLVFWQSIDPKVLILFVMFLALAEIFIQVRWRLSMSCPHCGFDPVLYMRDQRNAAAKVRQHLERRKNRADFVLSSKNPMETLPKIKLPPGEKAPAPSHSPPEVL